MPVQLQSLAYDFQMYYFLQTYSKFWLEYPIVFLSSRHVQEEMDDTFYRSFGFPLEYQSKQLYHPIPDEPNSSQNTGRKSSKVIGFNVAGFKRGAGLFFISARTLYHCFGSSLSLNKFIRDLLCLA